MVPRTLLIATTPLTVLVGTAVARSDGGRWRLAIVEDFADAPAWTALLADWRGNPFEAIERLPGRATEAQAERRITARGIARRLARERSKRALRREAFARLATTAGRRPSTRSHWRSAAARSGPASTSTTACSAMLAMSMRGHWRARCSTRR
jgi:hypothetical protein